MCVCGFVCVGERERASESIRERELEKQTGHACRRKAIQNQGIVETIWCCKTVDRLRVTHDKRINLPRVVSHNLHNVY